MPKGDFLGECNRTACSASPATYFNYSTRKFYCDCCALLINQANHADAIRAYGHELCLEMSFDPTQVEEHEA